MQNLFGFLILVSLVMLFIGLISPKTGLFWLGSERTRKQVILVYGVGLITSFIGFGFFSPGQGEPQNASKTDRKTASEVDKPQVEDSPSIASYKSELLETRHMPTVQNFYFLITTDNYSREHLNEIALKLREENCSKQCNVSLYSDKKSWQLDKDFQKFKDKLSERLTNGEITLDQWRKKHSEWEEKNYCEMAEYFIGELTFGSDDFWYYPYKDDRYKELGGKNPKK